MQQPEAAHAAWVVGIQQDGSGSEAVASVGGGSGSVDPIQVHRVRAGRPEGVARPGAAVARPHGPGSEARAPTARELAAASEEVQRRATQAGLHWIQTHTHLAPPPASSRAGTSRETVEESRTLSWLPAASLWQQPGRELGHQPDKLRRAASGSVESGSRLCVQPPRALKTR